LFRSYYNWCHATDTIAQLYTIVGFNVCEVLEVDIISFALKSCSVAARVLLKRANLSIVLMYVKTDVYGSTVFFSYFFC